MIRRPILSFMAALLAVMLPVGLAAQELPDRPVRFIVPFVPGGGSDAVARIVAEGMGPQLSRGIVVENRGGANGMIGMAEVARSRPDGGVVGLCFMGPCALNPSLYPNQPYDMVRDFAPVGLIGTSTNVLTVPVTLPVRSVADLVTFARGRTEPLSYGSSGVGSTTHLLPELLRGIVGMQLLHVPYGGGVQVADHLAGRVDLLANTTMVMVPHVRSGTLRALATSGPARDAAMPEIPTFAEVGFPQAVMSPWFAIVAPAGTPAPVVARLNAALNAALAAPATVAKLQEAGIAIQAGSPDDFAGYLRAEIAKWSEVIRANGIRVE